MTLILSGTNGLSDVDGSAATPAIRGTDTNTGIFFPAADTVGISTGGTERARVDSSGNLGLGVTPSAWASGTYKAFQVSGGGAISGSTGQVNLSQNWVGESGADKYISTAAASSYAQALGVHKWFNAPSGTAGNAITFTQAMTLDSSGNLGVGSTSPAMSLNGNTRALYLYKNDTNGAGVRLESSNTNFEIIAGDSGVLMYSTGDDPIRFGTSNTERARIDSSGNLLVGTTGTGFTNRIASVSSANSSWGLFSQATASSGTVFGIRAQYTAQAPNNTANYFFFADDSSLTRFYVASNGGIYNYSANNSNLSDRREKTNFAPAGDYLAKICAIPVQTFNYLDQNLEEDDGLTLGVVAQDVQAVAPELVTEANWGTPEEPKMRLSIYQTDLQYALMKCIQEQQAIITALTARIEALEQA